jgi:hypothetical protein
MCEQLRQLARWFRTQAILRYDAAGRSMHTSFAFGHVVVLAAAVAAMAPDAEWPGALAGSAEPEDREVDELIADQPVCVVSKLPSAGVLSKTMLYRYEHRGSELDVGYFVHWSTERALVPGLSALETIQALVADALYTHVAFVLPGFRNAYYGPGDVEGFRVTYVVRDDGSLEVDHGVADDGRHRPISLSADDLLAPDGSIVLMTEVWSHQLGAKGAARHLRSADARAVCFHGDRLVPLTEPAQRVFRLGSSELPRRAKPAWTLASHERD